MKTWVPCELHTHTFHSDGRQSLDELAASASWMGLAFIALTDHNTQSGLVDRERVERESGIQIVPGMEWTTFYGHMLTIGVHEFVDWRAFGPGDLHRGIAHVHRQGGVAGIAHPFRIGSPICTGCFWEFAVNDWNDLDFIEVWSTLMPTVKRDSRRAFGLWTELLDKGHRLTATSGRDWHETKPDDAPAAVTYLGFDGKPGDDIAAQAAGALRSGSAVVTMGPLLTFSAVNPGSGKVCSIGEQLELSDSGTAGNRTIEFEMKLDLDTRREHYRLEPQTLRLVLTGGTGVLHELRVPASSEEFTLSVEVPPGCGWIRAELYGCLAGAVTMIAFTNPVFCVER
ncbi:CehA/McbA family metallohydrolase [Paenibacillus beijingensis]|uniref:Histidinol phosphatase n=1 Tax=Paenibacillus beijingensis TaxID=1126833 RepID=A0A0D5NJP1_9BACL|nr:CehA/McbA family metallohydrolase [Paenibacillus beijingensis]AJY75594.1 histidinol phosphatase [Paenibacillus beijingensis]